jgi:hypothetical protein
LIDGGDPAKIQKERFEIRTDETRPPVYEFLSAYGSVKNGKLSKTWSPPPPSSTNAAVLYPHILKHFVNCIHQRTPNVL